jgi:hypothetical protein
MELNQYKNPKIIFTRYLYIYQEACASLVVELLRNDDGAEFENVMWWINELYYSGFHDELWCLCLKIYYWFYIDLYPHMEKYIIKQIDTYSKCKKEFVINEMDKEKQNVVEKQIIKLLLSTYKNLFTKRTNININTSKNARHYHIVNSIVENYGSNEDITTKVGFKYSKGRKTRFVMNFIKYVEKNGKIELNIERKRKIKGFVEALEKNNIETIYYFTSLYVKEKMCEKMKLFDLLLELYAYISSIKNKDTQSLDIYLSRKRQIVEFDLSSYINPGVVIHIDVLLMIVAFDCYSLFHDLSIENKKDTLLLKKGDKKTIKKHIYVTANNKLLDVFETFNLDKTKRETHGYRTLKNAHHIGHTRKISDEIALFTLNRDYYDEDELKDILWYNWEYYTKGCPLWVMRIQEANGYYDDASKSVLFHEKRIDGVVDDSNQQTFYDKYGLEPDEQSQIIQDNILLLNELEETNKLVDSLSFSTEEKGCYREKEINNSLFYEICNKYEIEFNQINFGF